MASKKDKQITVRAAVDQESSNRGWTVENDSMLTLKEAKAKAKYYISEQNRIDCESSTRLTYAQVLVNGVVEYDYFSRSQENK